MVPCYFQRCLEPVNTLIAEWCSEATPSRRFSSNLFRKQKFPKYLGKDSHPFFQNVLSFMHNSEMEQKIQKMSSVFQIKAFEVVPENSAYCGRNTCHWSSMC